MKYKSSQHIGSLTIIAALALAVSANAAINMQTVRVGDAGNPNDSTGYGAVNYEYRIGTYEVTNSQYAEFLNNVAKSDPHGLYHTNMTTNSKTGGIERSGTDGSYTYSAKAGRGNKPVAFVDFWSACRFTNWLTNGQGSGSTETGVYNLGGVSDPNNTSVTRNITAFNAGGYAIASDNEWYKAAYYDPSAGGPADDYWLYPTRSDDQPTSTGPNSTDPNSANCDRWAEGLEDVGSYQLASSHYGTFDQGGNLEEWTDTILTSSNRVIRGGSFGDLIEGMESTRRTGSHNLVGSDSRGFRITQGIIPEPASYALLLGFGAFVFLMIRRRIRH